MADSTKDSEILRYASLSAARLTAAKELDREECARLDAEMQGIEKALGQTREEILARAKRLVVEEK